MDGKRRRVLVAWVAAAAATSLACGHTRKNDKAPAGESGSGGTGPSSTEFVADCAEVLSGQGYGYCAVYQDGSTWCWGTGADKQPQSFVPSSEPRQIEQYGLKRLVLGPRHACGLNGRSLIECWGDSDHGQIYEGGPPAPNPLKGIGLGETQTCVIDFQSHVYCWGTDEGGELSPPVQVDVAGDPETSMPNGTLDVFDQHGRVFDIRTRAEPKLRANLSLGNAWFNLETPQQCLLKRAGSLWCSDYDAAPGAPLRAKTHLRETVVQAVTGASFLCALTMEGAVWCEGENLSGQTGSGQGSAFNEGGWVPGLDDVRSIAAAEASACVLTGDGSVWCWGAYGAEVTSATPVQVSGCTATADPPDRPGLSSPSGTGSAARLGEAGQARGEAGCACFAGADSESYDECSAEENFASNAMCIAALAPNDPYWSCRADNFWIEAACFSEADCEPPIELGACPPSAVCSEQQLPQVERFCRRFECAVGESLHKRYLCDGVGHCADGSDELNCTPGLGAFECTDGSQVTVPQLCDGTPDCPDGSDEGRCL